MDNYRTDLPIKKGLSSSAAVCVPLLLLSSGSPWCADINQIHPDTNDNEPRKYFEQGISELLLLVIGRSIVLYFMIPSDDSLDLLQTWDSYVNSVFAG